MIGLILKIEKIMILERKFLEKVKPSLNKEFKLKILQR